VEPVKRARTDTIYWVMRDPGDLIEPFPTRREADNYAAILNLDAADRGNYYVRERPRPPGPMVLYLAHGTEERMLLMTHVDGDGHSWLFRKHAGDQFIPLRPATKQDLAWLNIPAAVLQ